jgi:hypothetical protein
MDKRGITPEDVEWVLQRGDVINSALGNRPLPTILLLGFPGGRPLHVVVAYDTAEARCMIVTCYEPDPDLWDRGSRTRRHP